MPNRVQLCLNMLGNITPSSSVKAAHRWCRCEQRIWKDTEHLVVEVKAVFFLKMMLGPSSLSSITPA